MSLYSVRTFAGIILWLIWGRSLNPLVMYCFSCIVRTLCESLIHLTNLAPRYHGQRLEMYVVTRGSTPSSLFLVPIVLVADSSGMTWSLLGSKTVSMEPILIASVVAHPNTTPAVSDSSDLNVIQPLVESSCATKYERPLSWYSR